MNIHHRALPALMLTTALAATACGGHNETPSPPADTAASPEIDRESGQSPSPGAQKQAQGSPKTPVARQVSIEIDAFAFSPDTLTVPSGTAVTWVQRENSLHTVDFTDGIKSGDLRSGDTYSRTFTEKGTYGYVCFYHPRMTGTIIVE